MVTNKTIYGIVKGVWKSTTNTLSPWQSSADQNKIDLCNHEKALLLEFYRLKNSDRDAGSIKNAEGWLLHNIQKSTEFVREWEVYLQVNETIELKRRRVAREEQKVAAAKKTLARSRRKIFWQTWLIEKLSVQVEETPHQWRNIESPLRPNIYGLIQEKPNGRRPSRLDPQETNSRNFKAPVPQHVIRDGFVSTYHIPTPSADRLRADKKFGKYMVPVRKESPLREIVTRAQAID